MKDTIYAVNKFKENLNFFPINTEEEIDLAIRNFRRCPVTARPEFIENVINRMIKIDHRTIARDTLFYNNLTDVQLTKLDTISLDRQSFKSIEELFECINSIEVNEVGVSLGSIKDLRDITTTTGLNLFHNIRHTMKYMLDMESNFNAIVMEPKTKDKDSTSYHVYMQFSLLYARDGGMYTLHQEITHGDHLEFLESGPFLSESDAKNFLRQRVIGEYFPEALLEQIQDSWFDLKGMKESQTLDMYFQHHLDLPPSTDVIPSFGVQTFFDFNGDQYMISARQILAESQIPKLKNLFLNEGVKIDGDGSILISLREKSHFMEKYNQVHKILKLYMKAGNIEGVKILLYKLWYLYLVIENYYVRPKKTKKVDEDRLKDATKAKSFILNDFTTGLKWVLERDKEYNFEKEFSLTEYNKDVIKFTTENVRGIKKFILTLLT